MQFPSTAHGTERARSQAFFINFVPSWHRSVGQRRYNNTASCRTTAAGRTSPPCRIPPEPSLENVPSPVQLILYQIQSGRTLDMRTKIAFAAIIGVALLGSTLMANAQTGEFAGQVPSSVICEAWQLQDQLQSARSGTPAKSVNRTVRSYGEPNSVKPRGSVITNDGAKARE